MNKKVIDKNKLLINSIKNLNYKRDYLTSNKDIYNTYNKAMIKRNPTTIKTGKINNMLNEDIIYKNNNEFNQFNSNNNESIKNLFLRNNKVLYTSPDFLLDLRKLDNLNSNSNSNSNSNIKLNPKFINRNYSQYSQKLINRKNIFKKIFILIIIVIYAIIQIIKIIILKKIF
jgi:hypothetical protein